MFTEETTLSEILKTEQGRDVLAENEVPCLGCSMMAEEMDYLKIGDIADMYGLDKKKIIEELNKKHKK